MTGKDEEQMGITAVSEDNAPLTGFHLKLLAVITMVVDHFGAVFLDYGTPEYMVCRTVGRLAFPIYCFLLVEGFKYTKNVYRYLARLAVFALISEVPFDFAIFGTVYYPYYQNVFFTLLLGLLGITVYDYATKNNRIFLAVMGILAPLVGAYFLQCDYSVDGVLLILLLYLLQNYKAVRFTAASVLLILMGISEGSMEYVGAFSFLLIAFLYNGKKGTGMNRYLFYVVYPVHLLLFGLIRMFM